MGTSPAGPSPRTRRERLIMQPLPELITDRHRQRRAFFRTERIARIAAATTGSGSGHGTGCIDTTYQILRPGRGEGSDRSKIITTSPPPIEHIGACHE